MDIKIKVSPMARITLNKAAEKPFNPEVDSVSTIRHSFAAVVAEKEDEAIMNAIVEAAEKAGITDLCVIDKEFILSAIKHELERREGVK